MPDDNPSDMQDTQTNEATPAAESAAPAAASTVQNEGAQNVEYKVPGFNALEETVEQRRAAPMDRFYEVHVPVWVELGRVEMPLGELMKLDEGSVLRLDRPVSDPVDLVSQGVKLARGEVVVIDDCFAVRIKEMVRSK